MKSHCKKIHKIIFSDKFEKLDFIEKQKIDEHIQLCSECRKTFTVLQKSDALMDKIKSYQPLPENEEEIIRSIMSKIEQATLRNRPAERISFLDKIIFAASKKSFRFALTSGLIFILSIYMVEEYTAVENISNLEMQLTVTGKNSLSKAELISFDNDFLKLLYGLYNFTRGNSSYIQLSKKILLVNKEDFSKLFADFDKLDENTKNRIKALQYELVNEDGFDVNKLSDAKIKTLQKEIERLNNELQKIKMFGGK